MTIDSLEKKVKNLNKEIRVEVTGGEIRVSGKSYPVKDKLKALGFQWDPENKEWYYLDPLENKPDEDTLKPSTEFTKDQLFAEENKIEGYAVPSPFFWEVWNSSKRKILLQWLSDREYELRKDGHLLGLCTNWIIYLPYGETIHIERVLNRVMALLGASV